MRPNADLAILNFLQREILKRGVVDHDFVNKHCIFSTGVTDIGYGLRNTDKYARPAEKDTLAKQLVVKLDKYEAIGQGRKPGEVVEQKNSGGTAGNHWRITFEDYAKRSNRTRLTSLPNSPKETTTSRSTPSSRSS